MTAIFVAKNMEQISTPQPTTTITARIATYFIALINTLAAGYFLFDTITSNRFPGAVGIRLLFALWFSAVLVFSIHSLIKPSWTKFIALLAIILLETGFLFYSLMGAIY